MCCFPLADERNKRKTYFSHELGVGPSMRGVMVTRFEGFFSDLPTHPPMLEGTKEVLSVLYKVIQFFFLL